MKKYGKYLLWLAALIPLMLFRDYTPDNELRYLSIADEALRDGHFFAFFNQGVAYADKPPLYLWIVMASRALFGVHSMLWLGLFSILPAFVVLYVMDKWVAGVVSMRNRLSGQLMLLTTAFFLGAMVVLRMDMLMCMFIVLSLRVFYRMYSGEGKKGDKWLFPFYIFLALFTKGPYGVMIPVAGVLVFLIVKKQWREIGKYLGWRTWLVLVGLSAVWFGAVYAEGGKEYLNNLLFNQTVNRAVDSFSHKKPVYFYLQTFGFALAPWCLLYAGVFIAGVRKKMIKTDLEKFFFTVFCVTFVMLSLISSKLEIYMLPAYPFLVYYVVLLLDRLEKKAWVKWMVGIPAILLVLSSVVYFVLRSKIPELAPLNSFLGILTLAFLWAGGLLALIGIYRKKEVSYSINAIAIGMLLTVFCAGFVVPDYNSEIGYGNLAGKGEALAKKHGITTYTSYKVPRAVGMEVYLKKDVTEVKWEDLQEDWMAKEHTILFLRNKVIEREEPLQKLIEGKERYEVGQYSVVVW